MENLKTIPDNLSELILSNIVSSIDLKSLLLDRLPKIDQEIEIDDFPEFFQKIYNSFDYFHIKKLYEEIDIFKKYEENIKIEELKNNSRLNVDSISNSFNSTIKIQFPNKTRELLKIQNHIENLKKDSQNFENPKILKILNDNIGSIKKNIKKISEEKNNTLKDFLEKIKSFENTINKKSIAKKCTINNINLLSIYLKKNYNNEEYKNDLDIDVKNFLENNENKPSQNVEQFMNSFYKFQKENSFIAPHIVEYIIDKNDPIKELKESLFSKFSFTSLASNKKPLEDVQNDLINTTHSWLKDTDNSQNIIDHHKDLIKFSLDSLFGLDGDIITRLLDFVTNDLLVPEEQKGLWNGGIKGWIRGNFKIDEDLIGNQEEKLLLIKNIQTLKILLYFQLNTIVQNKKQLNQEEIKKFFQHFIDIWEKSLTSSMFKIYQLVENNQTIKNLHKFSGFVSFFSEDIGENLLLIRKLQEDSIKTEKKKLKEYYDQLKIEIGNNNEKKQAIDERYNLEINTLDEKLKSAQINTTDPKNIKNFLGKITNILLVNNVTFELLIKLSEIEKDNNIETKEEIENKLSNFLTEIKAQKETEKTNYIDFVKKIGGEFFFKKEIRDEIKKYLKDKQNKRIEDEDFIKKLKEDFYLNDDIEVKIRNAFTKVRITEDNRTELIVSLFNSVYGENFNSTSPTIFNIKNKIIFLREEIKKTDSLINDLRRLKFDKILEEKKSGLSNLQNKTDNKSLEKKTKLEKEINTLKDINQNSTEAKEIYVEWLSKKLGVNTKNKTITTLINENLVESINKISELKNLKEKKIKITHDEVNFIGENKKPDHNKKLIKTSHHITTKHHSTKIEEKKNKHGYIYSGVAGSIVTCGALTITGIFMKKDLSIENKVFASLMMIAIVLTILIACVLSYKHEIPNKIFNFGNQLKKDVGKKDK